MVVQEVAGLPVRRIRPRPRPGSPLLQDVHHLRHADRRAGEAVHDRLRMRDRGRDLRCREAGAVDAGDRLVLSVRQDRDLRPVVAEPGRPAGAVVRAHGDHLGEGGGIEHPLQAGMGAAVAGGGDAQDAPRGEAADLVGEGEREEAAAERHVDGADAVVRAGQDFAHGGLDRPRARRRR